MKYNKPAGDRLREIHPYNHRRNLIRLLCLAVMCVAFALDGCDLRKVDPSAEANSKKENNMESTDTATSIQHKIPPIDAALPVTETATFALG